RNYAESTKNDVLIAGGSGASSSSSGYGSVSGEGNKVKISSSSPGGVIHNAARASKSRSKQHLQGAGAAPKNKTKKTNTKTNKLGWRHQIAKMDAAEGETSSSEDEDFDEEWVPGKNRRKKPAKSRTPKQEGAQNRIQETPPQSKIARSRSRDWRCEKGLGISRENEKPSQVNSDSDIYFAPSSSSKLKLHKNYPSPHQPGSARGSRAAARRAKKEQAEEDELEESRSSAFYHQHGEKKPKNRDRKMLNAVNGESSDSSAEAPPVLPAKFRRNTRQYVLPRPPEMLGMPNLVVHQAPGVPQNNFEGAMFNAQAVGGHHVPPQDHFAAAFGKNHSGFGEQQRAADGVLMFHQDESMNVVQRRGGSSSSSSSRHA
ncbi:unnamed protein product, partial [Amoebophrya sp. A120]